MFAPRRMPAPRGRDDAHAWGIGMGTAPEVLTPGRIVRDAHGLMWQLDQTPRWAGDQLRVRARLLRCDGVWGDLPAEALEPTAVGVTAAHG